MSTIFTNAAVSKSQIWTQIQNYDHVHKMKCWKL